MLRHTTYVPYFVQAQLLLCVMPTGMHYVAQYGIRSIDGAEVCSVSRVYISDNWKVLPTFSNAARDTYDAMLESVDFSQAEQLAQVR